MEAISVREAARRLGISPTQARRYVTSGRLQTTGDGLARKVLWNEGADTAQSVDPTAHRTAQEMAHDGALVQRLESEVTYLRGALEREQIASAELRRLLQQQMPARLAPVDATAIAGRSELTEFQPAATPSTTEPATSKKKAWWRLW